MYMIKDAKTTATTTFRAVMTVIENWFDVNFHLYVLLVCSC